MENANQRPNLCPNRLVEALGKDQKDFTRDDIIRYIVDNGIKMVNFMYPAGDSRVKTLNFVINDYDYLETILTCGERVDGSSLFSYIEAGNSDLYVIPRFNTAFIDPFDQGTPSPETANLIPGMCCRCPKRRREGEADAEKFVDKSEDENSDTRSWADRIDEMKKKVEENRREIRRLKEKRRKYRKIAE